MKNIILLTVVAIGLLWACNPASPSVQKDYGNWSVFWNDFQAAVEKNDRETVKRMIHFGENIEEKDLDDLFDFFLQNELRDIVLKTPADKVEPANDTTFPEGKMIAFEETGYDDEGNEMGSALQLYFGKKDGVYGLMMMLAAG